MKSSDVEFAVLVPAEGDPHKLLGNPESTAWRLGARLPIANRAQSYGGKPAEFGTSKEAWREGWAEPGPCLHQPWFVHVGLVLIWNGQVVREGLDALRSRGTREDTLTAVWDLLPRAAGIYVDDQLELALAYLDTTLGHLGTLVVEDAHKGTLIPASVR